MGIKGMLLIVLDSRSAAFAYTQYRASWPAQIDPKTMSPEKV